MADISGAGRLTLRHRRILMWASSSWFPHRPTTKFWANWLHCAILLTMELKYWEIFQIFHDGTKILVLAVQKRRWCQGALTLKITRDRVNGVPERRLISDCSLFSRLQQVFEVVKALET